MLFISVDTVLSFVIDFTAPLHHQLVDKSKGKKKSLHPCKRRLCFWQRWFVCVYVTFLRKFHQDPTFINVCSQATTNLVD